MKVAPSVLSADFGNLARDVLEICNAGCDLVHVDVMDGHFVPNITIGPEVINKLRKYTSLPFDVHLMISPVHNFIKKFSDAGANIITIHPEATDNLEESINLIKKLNNLSSLLFINNNIHIDIVFDPDGTLEVFNPDGNQDKAAIHDVILESAISTICDHEDSVAAVDAEDKVLGYKNWVGLMKGDLKEEFEKWFKDKENKIVLVCLDEVQQIEDWEKFVSF